MKCAIYTRVSTDIQAEKEFSSCEAQEEKIRAFIKSQNNWNVFKIYSDPGFTGANLNRPALQELFEDIKQEKINIVLAYKIDRLTRSPKDFYQLIELFEKYKVDFISITERFDTSTPAGRLLRNIMLTFAQFERELASERTKDKMLQRAEKGMWNGGIPPFGYRAVDKKLALDEKEAKIVRLIFETYVETGSIAEIYKMLKERNIVNRNNSTFTKSCIRHILDNVIYLGKLDYSGKIYDGLHQSIISEVLFNEAQAIHKKKICKMKLYRNYLFAGLIDCNECGSKMTPTYTNKKAERGRKRYFYYRCTSTLKKDWQACTIRQVNADRLERFILDNLERVSKDEPYIENLCFRLNHNPEELVRNSTIKSDASGDRVGFELTRESLKVDPKKLIFQLQNFTLSLNSLPRSEQPILIKNQIQSVKYSKKGTVKSFMQIPSGPLFSMAFMVPN
jgi:site-specific DNA recombinase